MPNNSSWLEAYAERLLGRPKYADPKPPDSIPNDWGPAQSLVVSGKTQEPQRPFPASIGGMQRFLGAYNGGTPINTADMVHMPLGELGPQAVQGARDLVNMFMGRPQQEWGTLVPAPDPYNPLLPNGGT